MINIITKNEFINKIFKFRTYLPKGIMGRTITLLIAPMIFLQVLSGFVFFERHWNNINKKLSRSYVSDINSVVYLMERSKQTPKQIKNFANKVVKIDLTYYPKIKFEKKKNIYPYMMEKNSILEQIFNEAFPNGFNIISNEKLKTITTEINHNNRGTIIVKTPLNRLFSSSIPVFIIWLILGIILATLIVIPFVRSQVDSIENLAKLADAFGKGRENKKFKPTGATQIRQVGKSFLTMQQRLKRYIENRTNMLSGVSHDLRSPLTRMKLELEFTKDKELKKHILHDIEDMETMINGYLDFARGQGEEKTKKINLNKFLEGILSKYRKTKKEISFNNKKTKNIKLSVKENNLKRSIMNIINNAERYSKRKINILTEKTQDYIMITVEDDGPGIPKERREDMFKPFVRMESSRNTKTGGIGLGLAITKEIILSHGGNIELNESEKLKGLSVKVTIPQ